MDTITIDRLERDRQTLIVAPPHFVFAVQETTVNDEPAWEARVRDESPLPLPAPRSLLPPGSLRGWVASNEFALHAVGFNRADLKPQLVFQILSWYDGGLPHSKTPYTRAMIDRVRGRIKGEG